MDTSIMVRKCIIFAFAFALADEKGRCDMSDFPFGGEYRA